MRILLFQIRNPDDKMLEQELTCFATKLEPLRKRLPFSLSTHNIIAHQGGYERLWRDYDLILVGGSGDYGCVENTDYWFLTFCDMLREIVEAERPMFCSCFGHQALAVALGGEVISDKSRAELGTLEVNLNQDGREDPLLGALEDPFPAQFGHNDQVSRLPEGAVNMAYTERCPVQSYKFPGKLVYCSQFHPELSHYENRERAERYFRVYDPSLADPAKLDTLFRPSQASSDLLPRFVRMVKDAG